jgi:hypothetical protein
MKPPDPTSEPATPGPEAGAPAAAGLRLPEAAFLGRTFADYRGFLGLEDADIIGRQVLDVAAGPSSFAAEAVRLGVRVTAVDPLYDRPVQTLANLGRAGLRRDADGSGPQAGSVNLDGEPAAGLLHAERARSLDCFLRDYAAGRAAGRYFAASLPELPFRHDSFDLVTCAHFLFLQGDRLPFQFHVDACRELARLARIEARIYPLVTLEGQRYRNLDRLLRHLQHCGIGVALRPVERAILPGANQMLVLRRLLR